MLNLSQTKPVALRVKEFCKLYGIGRTKLYELINRRELRPRKSGKQTLIPTTEAERWFESLPIVSPSARPRTSRLRSRG
jgi:excisionase family DNA binding protein